jgi:3-hydroxybutyryl-CoA dehydratase
MNGETGSGAWFDDVRVGERFARTLTVTETHLVLGAGLIGDFNPHHVDESYARQSRFGTRILHGMLTSAIMGAPVGMHFHGTALAYLEHNTRFIAPVRAGDTLTTTWTVTELLPKPRQSTHQRCRLTARTCSRFAAWRWRYSWSRHPLPTHSS